MSMYPPAPGGTPAGQAVGLVGPPELHREVAAQLHQGEQLSAALVLQVDGLLPPKIPRRYRIRKSVNVDWWAPVRFVASLFFPSSWGWIFEGDAIGTLFRRQCSRLYRALRRPTHGGSWSGGYDSTAGSLFIAVRNNTLDGPLSGLNDDFVLAVTSHRLLVLSEPFGAEYGRPHPAQLLAEYPRGTFGKRREPHPARQIFRADVEFGDGSWIALRLPKREEVAQLTSVLG